MYKEKIKEYFQKHSAELIEDICQLIRIESVHSEPNEDCPFGENNIIVLNKAKEIVERIGFSANVIGNRVLTMDLNKNPACLDILAHLDVVPGGDNWTVTSPFVPIIHEGKLYGRGSSDDKGPAIAAMYAIRAVRDLGIELKGNVRLILGTDEESGSRDIEYYYKTNKEAPYTFSPDAEFPLINLEKGRLHAKYTANWEEEKSLPRLISIDGGTTGNVVAANAVAVIEGLSIVKLQEICRTELEIGNITITESNSPNICSIEYTGKSAHASTPWEGNNAITALLKLVANLPLANSAGFKTIKNLSKVFEHGDYYGKSAGVAMKDEVSGDLTICTNVLNVSTTGLIGSIDSRTPICANNENMLEVLRKVLEEGDIFLEPSSKMIPVHYVPEDSFFVKTLLNCYEQYFDEKGHCVAIGGGTYVHDLERGVAFGCMLEGTDYKIHGANEFLVIDEIIRSAQLFTLSIIELCK